MSALEGKGDPSTSAVSENIIPPDKLALTKPTDHAENTTKSPKLGVGDTKKDETDGTLVSLDSGTVEKGNIVDTNLKSDTLAEGDQIFEKTAPDISITTSIEVPSTSKATIDDPETTFEHKTSATNEHKSESDGIKLKHDHIILSGENVPKDCIPDIELENTKESTNLVSNNNPFDDVDDSFDDDLELKWEDDEKDDNYSTNLSEEALKLLDKELGIDEKVGEIETNKKTADDIIKQSIDTVEKVHIVEDSTQSELIVEDSTQSEVNKHILVKTEELAKNVTENIDKINTSTKIDTNTKTLPEIYQSTDEGTDEAIKQKVFSENKDFGNNTKSESELIEPDVNSSEEITVSGSNTATDISKEHDIVKQNAKMEETNEQNQPELIIDRELISRSNNDIVEDVLEPQDSHEMDLDTPNIAVNSEITQNIEEMDVDLSEDANKIELVDNPIEITKQSNVLEQESQIKIHTTTAIKEINYVPLKTIDTQEKTLLRDCVDIEMTEITDQSLREINSSNQMKENPLPTKNESDLNIQEVPIDEVGKVLTDEDTKNTETEVTTTQFKEDEVPSGTKGMKTDLGLNKPDVMLEIPTQELIDIEDFDDSLELEKEIIDSKVNNTSNDKNNTLTLKTKPLLEEHTITNDKNIKLTTEHQKTTIQCEEKDITVTELVKTATEKEQSVEIMEKLDKNNIKIDDKVDNPIPSDDNVTESNSTVNDGKVTGETSSKVSDDDLTVEPIIKIGDDNAIKETTPKTTDSDVTVETISKSNENNTTVPTTKATDENMTIEPISKPIDDCTTEDQISEINDSQMTKETSNVDDNITAEISEENLNISENASKDDDNMTEETSKLDKIVTSEPISKLNMTEDNGKTTKESPTNENIMSETTENTQNMIVEASNLDENMTAESIPKANNVKMAKESSVDGTMTAELSKDNPNTTETTSKVDDDMTEEPEISDSLGLLAESSRVMDDDDQDEDDDSDDFDQDDESSNLQTAEHSEESNPPSDEAQRDDKDMPIPEESVVEGEGIIYNEDTNTGLEIVDDIVCEETDIVEKVGATIESIIEPTLGNEILKDESQPKEIEESSDTSKKEDVGVLRDLLLKGNEQDDESKKSPSKSTRLSINTMDTANVMTYVDLEESSDDDIQEINKSKSEEKKEESDDVAEEKHVEESKPKPTLKMTKLNTSEVTIKTGVSSKPPLIIPEITNVSEIEKAKDNVAVENKRSLEEIYNLDSDSEEEDAKKPEEKIVQAKFNPKCINAMCISPSTDQHYVADAAAMRHYGATKRRAICAPCLASVDTRNEALIKGIKDLTPLLDLNMEKPTNQLVEISDSESDDESDLIKECNELIGQEGAKILNDKLADLINDAWQKFNMDDRLKDSENYINGELMRLEDEGTEINKLLNECQVETDTIRNELYKTFERSSRSLPPLTIHDTPTVNYTCLEKDDTYQPIASPFLRSALEEPPAKRQNRGLTQTNTEVPPTTEAPKQVEDDRDVSVVLLSAESAPDDLPPPGEVVRAPLRVGMQVHAMRNAFGSWLRGRILDIQPKVPGQPYTNCRVKFDHNIKNPCKVLPARCIAYQEPCSVRMTIGTRVLALFKDSNRKESFYSGVVAEIPNPVNSYRYLVFFDDGYAQYVKHKDTRLVCESKSTVWEEVHPFIRDFVKDYLLKYPERPMVRLHAGQRLNTEWNGKWWTSKVLQVDASLAHVHFEEDDRTEWIYRGSTRLAPLYLELQAAGRSRTRLPRSKAQFRTNMPYVEYMRSEEQSKQQQQLQQEEMIRRQRAVAKKSVSLPQPTPMVDKPDNVTSRVVYYTPKNAVKPYKMVPHACGPQCRRTDVLSLKELRTYNPLAKPLLSGWERMQVRFKGSKHIMYRAPCGRRIRDMKELHRYLRCIQSDLPVDLFDFNVNTHCLAEFVLHKYNVMKKDLSHGKESVPVPCVNYYDDSLPEFCSYNTERTPTAGVPLNLDPDFLCGCDCEDDCEDKSKCACWRMTLEGARTIGLDSPNVGYVYRRLPEPLPSGIYECNSRCKCKSTCLNRVAQHPLQLKLQVFKTLKRGWGIRALNDVPKGSFLCVYAGNLLTDATANLDGLNEGDEYLAELDYIEVVEQMKEGFEEDIPEADKKLDKKESKQSSSEEEETESEEDNRDSDKDDNDFQPGYIGLGLTEFNKRLRKRGKKKQNEAQDNKDKDTEQRKTDDCITISDDEEVREPSRFTAQAGMGDKGFVSKYRSVRTLFGKDEACYIMDAKVQGNIGRYLNHSCCPNVFVQNVFVDTHDPRFPWVAFFALSHIRAGTELTWNYNYDIGSVPGKILYCYCGAHNCRGRLL